MAKIGDESLQVSVCRDSVIHVVATPKSLDSIRHDQPWMLDPRQSCPGAQFQFAETGDTASLTTATVKVEFSLTRGNLKYSRVGGENLLRESDAVPHTHRCRDPTSGFEQGLCAAVEYRFVDLCG
jgi:hypothetical protein